MSVPLLERVPPQSLEAEHATLGSMLVEREAISAVAGVLCAADFYRPQHGALYQAMIDMFNASEAVDIVTLQARLQDREQLERVGGTNYLIELQESAPTAAAVGHYARIVKDKATLRNLIRAGGEIARAAQAAGDEDVQSVVATAQRMLAEVDKGAGGMEGFLPWSEVLKSTYNEFEVQMKAEKRTIGIPTGLSALDRTISGWQPGTYYVIAARPSIGKTAFALAESTEAAARGQRVAMFSLEMTAGAMVRRHWARRLELDLTRINNATVSQEDVDGLARVCNEGYKWPLYVCERSDLRIGQLRAQARHLAQKIGGLDLVVVDYLQLLGPDTRGRSRNDELTEVSAGLKAMCLELDCAVMALSQLSRDCEKERRVPRLSDLRDSGSIEQDGDVVIFLSWPIWLPEFQENGRPNKGLRRVDVAKQRNGQARWFDVAWAGPFQRFADLERNREEEEA